MCMKKKAQVTVEVMIVLILVAIFAIFILYSIIGIDPTIQSIRHGDSNMYLRSLPVSIQFITLNATHMVVYGVNNLLETILLEQLLVESHAVIVDEEITTGASFSVPLSIPSELIGLDSFTIGLVYTTKNSQIQVHFNSEPHRFVVNTE